VTFSFRNAVRENVGLLIALAGASGSGKTYSALRLATGLAGGKPFAFIDTEARRGLHYADRFDFLHADMGPPFRPERFVEAIQAAEQAGAGVVIIDSASHEYEGVGGIMEWADELAERGVKSPGNWKEPKLAHRRMMQALLQARVHLIFCLRADEKIEIVREGGKTQVRPLGWMPICEKRFMYEMTASFTLTPEAPGRVRYGLPHKCQEQHRAMFADGALIGEDAGAALAAWARGEGAAPAAQPQPAGPDGWPMLAPDASLKAAPDAGAWVKWCAAALAKLPDVPDVDQWTMSMEPHFVALANFDANAVSAVKRAAGDRRAAIMEARDA
jgi:hypothetical protein